MGLFPIGAGLVHWHWIGSIDKGTSMPMLCQFWTMHYQSPVNWEIKFNWQRKTNRKLLTSNPYQGKVDAVPIRLEWKISLEQSLGYQWSANWVPMDCQLSASRLTLPIDSQWNVNLHPIICHLIVNWMPIDCLSDNNWNPIWCHLRSNPMSIDFKLNTNLLAIRWQFKSNQMPINFRWNNNWLSIRCQ